MYSAIGQSRLQQCHIDLQKIFNEADRQGVVGSIFCGWRSAADQEQAFLSNKSKVRYPNSKHNSSPSMATDAGPYFIEIKNTDWNDRLAFALYAGKILMIADQLLRAGEITHILVWGGDWDKDNRSVDHKFLDLPHFELQEKAPDGFTTA